MPLCECGCGRERNTKYPGVRFIRGHQNRGARRKAVLKTYRSEMRDGQQMHVHRKRAEQALGKTLPSKAVVHHADGSISDDAPLVICQNQAYHRLLHARMRVKAAGGNPNTDKVCSDCGLVKPKAAFYQVSRSSDGYFNYCRDCTRVHNSAEYKRQQKGAA